MSTPRKVAIDVTPNGIGSTVLIDGEPVKDLVGFRLEARAGEVTTLTLELTRIEATVLGDAYTTYLKGTERAQHREG